MLRYNNIYLKNRNAFEIFRIYPFEVSYYINILKVINKYVNIRMMVY
jgi:hypothetical protein